MAVLGRSLSGPPPDANPGSAPANYITVNLVFQNPTVVYYLQNMYIYKKRKKKKELDEHSCSLSVVNWNFQKEKTKCIETMLTSLSCSARFCEFFAPQTGWYHNLEDYPGLPVQLSPCWCYFAFILVQSCRFMFLDVFCEKRPKILYLIWFLQIIPRKDTLKFCRYNFLLVHRKSSQQIIV